MINFQIANWDLRISLFNKLFDFIENQEFIKLSKDELRLKQSVLNMIRKRLQAGIASQIDLDKKIIELNKINQELLQLQMNQSIIRNQLASLIGLSTEKFNLIPLDSKKITSILDSVTVLYLKNKKLLELQEISLTKRLDLRKALSNYEIAEDVLKKSKKIYEKSLRAMFRVLKNNGKVSIVTPRIKTRDNNYITFSFRKMVKESGFILDNRLYEQPFVMKESGDQKVLREIWLLKKN